MSVIGLGIFRLSDPGEGNEKGNNFDKTVQEAIYLHYNIIGLRVTDSGRG